MSSELIFCWIYFSGSRENKSMSKLTSHENNLLYITIKAGHYGRSVKYCIHGATEKLAVNMIEWKCDQKCCRSHVF